MRFDSKEYCPPDPVFPRSGLDHQEVGVASSPLTRSFPSSLGALCATWSFWFPPFPSSFFVSVPLHLFLTRKVGQCADVGRLPPILPYPRWTTCVLIGPTKKVLKHVKTCSYLWKRFTLWLDTESRGSLKSRGSLFQISWNHLPFHRGHWIFTFNSFCFKKWKFLLIKFLKFLIFWAKVKEPALLEARRIVWSPLAFSSSLPPWKV